MGIFSKATNSLNVNNLVEQSLSADFAKLKGYMKRFVKIALNCAFVFIAWQCFSLYHFVSNEYSKIALDYLRYENMPWLGKPHLELPSICNLIWTGHINIKGWLTNKIVIYLWYLDGFRQFASFYFI
jgi:hypothetical protein